MAFKMVGVDQNDDFPPRVETKLASKIASGVAAVVSKTGAVNGQVPTWNSTQGKYVPGTNPASSALDDLTDVAAPAPTNGQVLTWDTATSKWVALAVSAPSGNVLRTAYVNFPPVWEKVTTTATGANTRGIYFVCTNSGTVKKLRAKINSTAGQTYTLGIYELSPTNRTTVTAVTGTATFTETVSTTGKIIEVDANIALVAGKYYLISIYTPNGLTIYYTNSGGYFGSAVSSTVFEGAVDPQRSAAGLPAVNTVMTGGSDYVCVGMSVEY